MIEHLSISKLVQDLMPFPGSRQFLFLFDKMIPNCYLRTNSILSRNSKTKFRNITQQKSFKNTIKSEFPSAVKIVEVGARDGLQNEKKIISPADKVKFIELLSETGLTCIEATSFVSPKWIPQMEDNVTVLKTLKMKPNVSYPVLVPNISGLGRAIDAGAKEIAIFVAASESFSVKNLNCSIEKSFERYKEVTAAVKKMENVKIRGYVSCVMGCPYEGIVPIEKVVDVSRRLYDMGCYELSLGDTIGVGTVGRTIELITAMKKFIPVENLAVHFHDTYGQALANILASLQMGIGSIDSSVSGLGGCPYAKGATGNVATEEVLYLLNGLGIPTVGGVNLPKLMEAGAFMNKILGRTSSSKVAVATESKGELPPNYHLYL